MLVPIVKKISTGTTVSIERALPVQGEIRVRVGDSIEPFDRLGDCEYSHRALKLPVHFSPAKLRTGSWVLGHKEFYYYGNSMGTLDHKKVPAPYNGYLLAGEDGWVFSELESKFILLSGVWGKVEKIAAGHSVLVSTQVKDLNLVACTENYISGEFVVFPNPTDVVKDEYLDKFLKDPVGKIVYVGDHVDLPILKKAYKVGIAAVICGSCDRNCVAFAKERAMGFGVISGFGKIPTPDDLFKFLSKVNHRHVFFEGERNILRIPDEPNESAVENSKTPSAKTCLKKLSVGDTVQVFQKPYFGRVGNVDTIKDSSILVKFGDKEPAEILAPNFVVFELD